MVRILLLALLAWFLYNIIFRFVLPIYRTTRRMKKQFREMHDRVREQQSGQTFSAPRAESPKPVGDYIDFEELK